MKRVKLASHMLRVEKQKANVQDKHLQVHMHLLKTIQTFTELKQT